MILLVGELKTCQMTRIKASGDMCIGITTDGVDSMTGTNLGVMKRMTDRALNATCKHCFLHREALAAKDMVPVLHETLKDVVEVVNYIKQSAKNTQCFQKLCHDLGSEHVQVLYHAEVRWLWRGKVLSCFYELQCEIAGYLAQNNSPLADLFSNSVWLAHIVYLADVFEKLKILNVSMQGRGHTIFEQYDKIDALKKRFSVWACHVSKNQRVLFPNARNEGQQLDRVGKNLMSKTITSHLNKLLERFNDYFPEKQRDNDWIRDPFGINMESITLPGNEDSELVELSYDRMLRQKFTEVSLSHFWCSTVVDEYPSLATQAVILLPFSTTYLCECGFSALVQLKTKHRSRWDNEHDLRVALSTITPDFETLVRTRPPPPVIPLTPPNSGL